MNSATKLTIFVTLGTVLTSGYTCNNSHENQSVKVEVFLGTECPVSRAYTSRLNEMYSKYAKQGVQMVGYFPQASDSEAKMKAFVKEYKIAFPCKIDSRAANAKNSNVVVIPTAQVVNNQGKVAYFGAIDNNKNKSLATKHFLSDAISRSLSNQTVTVTKTDAFGCVLSPKPEPKPMMPATYSESVAKILNDHCVTCHRPGEIGPFSLVGYENAKNWAPTIAKVVTSGKMPPWKAVEGVGSFKHENRLTQDEVSTIEAWAGKGAPRGNKAKEPKQPVFKPGWALGEPDLMVQIPKPFKISADGQDEYWHFVVKPDIKEPVYVQAVDVRPGNKKIVHHVILWIDDKGAADKVLAKKGVNGAYLTFGSPGFIPDNSLGGWAPGMMPVRTPENAGFLLKPGSNVVLEIHYHKSGKEEFDQTKVGLYLAKDVKKVEKPLEIAWLANPFIKIVPGEAKQHFQQTIPIPTDVVLYSLMPHMHLLGRKMWATLVSPDGKEEKLIQVDDWDFNWQFSYALKEPMLLKKGSKIRVEAEFDNSTNNPNNPSNPPKMVRWGEQTTDEMMLLVAAIHVPDRKQFSGEIGF